MASDPVIEGSSFFQIEPFLNLFGTGPRISKLDTEERGVKGLSLSMTLIGH